MRFSEAKGHKVISTADAETVAKVSGFAIDPASAKVIGMHLKKTDGDVDLLPWENLVGFGPDALTVASSAALVKAGPQTKGNDVLGVRVLSDAGVELGEVKDVDFDPETGTVRALLTKQGEVAGDRMLGLGGYALVVRA